MRITDDQCEELKELYLAHANFSHANLLSLVLNSGTTLVTDFAGAALDRVNFDEAQRIRP